jgi:hypothetical protein
MSPLKKFDKIFCVKKTLYDYFQKLDLIVFCKISMYEIFGSKMSLNMGISNMPK